MPGYSRPEAVREQLARILASPQFLGAERSTRFLQLTIERVLQDRPAALKEYTIGVEVFGRPASFDPRLDAIVRVEAGRLRARLKSYYENGGKSDPMLIDLPKGSYVPVFRENHRPSEPSVRAAPIAARSRARSVILLASVVTLMIVTAAGLVWWMSRKRAAPGMPVLTRLSSDSGLTFEPAISSDGKFVAYVSDRAGEGTLDLWLQQIGGGAPIRLTRSGRNVHEPCFSPDGSKIVFRSEREGGGIYAVPALGGEEKLVARRGRDPRFSPEGEWIAYWIGDPADSADRFAPNSAAIFVMPASGGSSRRLRDDFGTARYPAWSPDGTHILFLGSRQDQDPQVEWYVTPVGPGPAIRTGLLSTCHKRGLLGARLGVSLIPSQWIDARTRGQSNVLFSAIEKSGEGRSTNIWSLQLSSRYRAMGDPVQVTHGERLEAGVSCAGGRMVFASFGDHVDVWALPLASDQGRAASAPVRVTDDIAVEYHPTVSADGRIVTFDVARPGANGIWMHDLRSGRERAVSVTTIVDIVSDTRNVPYVSHDGKWVAYQVYSKGNMGLYISPVDGGQEEIVYGRGWPYDWLWSGRKLLVREDRGRGTPQSGLAILDLATKRLTLLRQPEPYDVTRPAVSPDDHWLAFRLRTGLGQSQIFIAPIVGNTLPVKRDLIPVTDTADCNQPAWAPSGDRLYFVSDRDGSRCIWAQRVDPSTKKPAGDPVAIYHFHQARGEMTSMPATWLNLSAASDKLVFNLNEISGNVWLRDEK